ncbi:MAG: hypothetical protein ACQETI_08985 [Halobacteriota archaeon]
MPDRRDFLKVLGVAGTASLGGCSAIPSSGAGGGADERTAERSVSGTYTTATSFNAQSLNWLSTADSTFGSYVGRVLDGAWAIDDSQEVFPLWVTVDTDDARVYTVSLRENLQWGADYGQMTAEDWVYLVTEVFQSPDNWAAGPPHRTPTAGSSKANRFPSSKPTR